MAEEDLYGDLSGLKQDTQAANTATAARVDSLAPPTAPKDVAKQPDESAAQNSDLQALDLGIAPGGERTATPEAGAPEEGLPEDLSVEDAFSRIAVAVSKKSESPRDVVLAVSALASQADAYKRRTTEQHQQHIAQQIQIADLMATVLKARKEAAEAKVDSHPSIIELRKMHCDPAIAREFELLKAENKKLQQEASRLRELDMGNKFEVRAPKGRQLVLKLKEVQEENLQLERELQGQDATLRQSELQGAQITEVQTAAKQLLAHNRMLQLQVEDAVAQAATLRKTDGRHGGFQLRKKRPDDNRQQRYRERGPHGEHYYGGGPPRDFGGDRWADNEPMRPGNGGLGGPGGRDLMGERQRHQHDWEDRGGNMMQRRRVQ